jgi:hypothetical protein
MLIFDKFASRDDAERFANAVCEGYGKRTTVFENKDDAQAADPIPRKLVPPIVHVEREDLGNPRGDALEREIIALVSNFSGRFAGT